MIQSKITFWLYKLFGIRILLISSRVLSIKTLKKVVGKIMLEVQYSSGFFRDIKFQGLYRARSHNHLRGNLKDNTLSEFTNESQFVNPPPKQAKMGRCNEKGESMFYCTTDLVTSIIEARGKINEFVTVASFVGLLNEGQFDHKMSPVGYRYLLKIPELSRMMTTLNPENRSQFNEVDDFLDNLFHMKIKKNAYYYKLSNAVAKCMLEDIQNSLGTKINQHGLVYSSILRNHKSYNLVFKPIFANYYKIDLLQTFFINQLSDNSIKFSLVRRGFLNGEKKHPSENYGLIWEDIIQNDQTTLTYDLVNSEWL